MLCLLPLLSLISGLWLTGHQGKQSAGLAAVFQEQPPLYGELLGSLPTKLVLLTECASLPKTQ